VDKATPCSTTVRARTTTLTGCTAIVTLHISQLHISNVSRTSLTKDMGTIIQELGPHQTTAEQRTTTLRLVEVLLVEADLRIRNIALTVAPVVEAGTARAAERLVETMAGMVVMEATVVFKVEREAEVVMVVTAATGGRLPTVIVATAAEVHTMTPEVEVGVVTDTGNLVRTFANSWICSVIVLWVCINVRPSGSMPGYIRRSMAFGLQFYNLLHIHK